MDIYFDLGNTISLIKQKDNAIFSDCIRLLKRQLDCNFNFSKSEIASNEYLIALFKLFTDGVGKTKKDFIETPFPDRPLKSNCYVSFDVNQLSSVYLIDDEKIDNIKKKGAILIGGIGEEIKLIESFFLHNDDYKLDRKLRIGGPNFTNWEDLGKFQFETSDILIFDPYIISDQNSIRTNLLPLLRVLSTKSFCKVNIVIYTKVQEDFLTYDQVKTQIKEVVSESTGVKSTFTLVRYRDQRDVRSPQAEHDRTIFTSYCRYYSGDTFNYWKEDGTKKTKGRELHIVSYADKENHNLAKELINDIQININSLPEEFIEGDKKSNFLNFN
jgi:hypothetical protein